MHQIFIQRYPAGSSLRGKVMPIKNVEIKARCSDHSQIRNILKNNNAEFKGLDHQIDTYFAAKEGRLKLREGNVENSLIYYLRENNSGPKESNIKLFKIEPGSSLKSLLISALDILVEVKKAREIYFIDNVKFHLDDVVELGMFVEIEAIDKDGSIGLEKLNEQCNYYIKLFRIQSSDLISNSYSDMLFKK